MSSVVVVDASIALKWVVTEPDSAEAQALLDEWARQGMTLLVPTLYTYEVTNILRQRVRRGLMTPDEARADQSKLLSQNVTRDVRDQAQQRVQSERALVLANQHNLPATYDAHYLALAEREGCEYWTADERLWNTVKAQLPWVRWLGERAGTGQAAGQPTPFNLRLRECDRSGLHPSAAATSAAARRPEASAPWTVPVSCVLVASPAKKSIPSTAAPSRVGASKPPARTHV